MATANTGELDGGQPLGVTGVLMLAGAPARGRRSVTRYQEQPTSTPQNPLSCQGWIPSRERILCQGASHDVTFIIRPLHSPLRRSRELPLAQPSSPRAAAAQVTRQIKELGDPYFKS